MFTSQIIQWVFSVSCFGIWWRHDIWISKKLKFDYLKKEKSFRSEIKNIFLVSQVLVFRHIKQNRKNVADTTFKGQGKPIWAKYQKFDDATSLLCLQKIYSYGWFFHSYLMIDVHHTSLHNFVSLWLSVLWSVCDTWISVCWCSTVFTCACVLYELKDSPKQHGFQERVKVRVKIRLYFFYITEWW